MASALLYRISGHESFPCRYTWLPKAAHTLVDNQKIFAEEDRAMVDLGVGKNMTCSIRFWMQAAGVASPAARGAGDALTEFGTALLGKRGFDPFLGGHPNALAASLEARTEWRW